MIKTANFTTNENIDLSKEISLIAPNDTPLFTYLSAKGLTDTTGSKVPMWREKTLDTTSNISQIEGSVTSTFQKSTRAEVSNVCEIFLKATEVSGTVNASEITGVPQLFAEEISDRLTEMKVRNEYALINGVKDDGSEDPFVRKMGGLLEFVPAGNKVAAAAAITEANFKATVRKLWEAGNSTGVYLGMCGADMKEAIDAIYDAKYQYIAQEELFGLVVRKIQTNYGDVLLVLNRHMPVKKLVIFNPQFLRITYLRKPHFEPLAKVGDSIRGQVLTENTLKVFNRKALAEYTDTRE